MWLSRKKYYQIIFALTTLLNRPYVKNVVENPDGSVLLQIAKGDKTFQFLINNEIEEDRGILQ